MQAGIFPSPRNIAVGGCEACFLLVVIHAFQKHVSLENFLWKWKGLQPARFSYHRERWYSSYRSLLKASRQVNKHMVRSFFWRCTIPDHPLPGELTFNYFLVCRKPQEERPTWKLDFACGIQSSWPLHIACFGACGSRLTIDCCFISDQATHWWFIAPHSPALLSAFLSINWLDVLFTSWHQVVEFHSIVSVGLLCCETKRVRIRTNVPIDPTFLRQPNWNNQRITNEMSWDVACHVPMFFN